MRMMGCRNVVLVFRTISRQLLPWWQFRKCWDGNDGKWESATVDNDSQLRITEQPVLCAPVRRVLC